MFANAAARKMWWIWLVTAAGGAVIILLASSLYCLGWKKLKLQGKFSQTYRPKFLLIVLPYTD